MIYIKTLVITVYFGSAIGLMAFLPYAFITQNWADWIVWLLHGAGTGLILWGLGGLFAVIITAFNNVDVKETNIEGEKWCWEVAKDGRICQKPKDHEEPEHKARYTDATWKREE